MNKSYTFDKQSVQRIADTVTTVEHSRETLPTGKSAYRGFVSRYKGKTTEAINKGSAGVVQVYSGDKGSEGAVSDLLIEAYSTFGDIEDDMWVFIEFIDGDWEIYQAECG